jgi:polysaccharide deacetylase 2 family uncharacterized protein YibQ
LRAILSSNQGIFRGNGKSPVTAGLFPLSLLIVISLLCASCKLPGRNAQPSANAIHGVTKELAAVARKSSPPGTVIRMKLQASAKEPQLPDWLEVTLFTESGAKDRQAVDDQLLRSLSETAARHKLQAGRRYDKESSSSISFQSGPRTTHFVEIRFVNKESPQKGKPGADLPRLAIILDDLGSDRSAAESIFAMPYPLTISILPNHEHSREIADEALQHGYQVMLHLPMQSVANEAPEKQELRPGMPAAEVQKLLGEMVESVPNAVGVNNHQGSQATSDPALMEELMPAVRNLNLFYVDSRTTAATVAFDTAKCDGVPAAFRNVPFLDDVQDVSAVRKQLQLALRGAKEKKSAIAIGHAHPATLEALREFLPEAHENGVQLVFVSELVH